MTKQSHCTIFHVKTHAEIIQALHVARLQGLSVIAHGAGHSYTDAALNTTGVVIDVTGMRRILAWDAVQGIMQVEPGVTIHTMVQVALADHWWPPVTPSTAAATIGGCVAMNVTGKNAWKCGAFGEHILSMTMLLASGEMLTIAPASHPQLFQAVVGSAGLLGIITSITLQLQRVTSSSVIVRERSAASLAEMLTIFHEEQAVDFCEAWVDGFARGRQLGRGIVTCATYSDSDAQPRSSLVAHLPDHLTQQLARGIGTTLRPVVTGGMHVANTLMYWNSRVRGNERVRYRSLYHSTFYPPAAFTGYQTLLPNGIETFQIFVPRRLAADLFGEIMRWAQARHFLPLWCVVKHHRPDPSLLSYQVDGFSLEMNFPILPPSAHLLHALLREFMDLVIAAGGRFYLAKDALLTASRYRQSVGAATVAAFLHLKHHYDPQLLFQSDLFRRVFVANAPQPNNSLPADGADVLTSPQGQEQAKPLQMVFPLNGAV